MRNGESKLLCRVKPSAGLRWKVSSRCSRSRRRAAMSNRRIEQWPSRRGAAQSAGPVDRRDRYPIPSSSAGRMERGLEFVDEFLQLFRIDVADSKEFETLRTPAPDVETLHRVELRPVTFGGSSLRDGEIDHMRAAPIDDRRDGLAVDVVEPPAEQREALRRQVD